MRKNIVFLLVVILFVSILQVAAGSFSSCKASVVDGVNIRETPSITVSDNILGRTSNGMWQDVSVVGFVSGENEEVFYILTYLSTEDPQNVGHVTGLFHHSVVTLNRGCRISYLFVYTQVDKGDQTPMMVTVGDYTYEMPQLVVYPDEIEGSYINSFSRRDMYRIHNMDAFLLGAESSSPNSVFRVMRCRQVAGIFSHYDFDLDFGSVYEYTERFKMQGDRVASRFSLLEQECNIGLDEFPPLPEDVDLSPNGKSYDFEPESEHDDWMGSNVWGIQMEDEEGNIYLSPFAPEDQSRLIFGRFAAYKFTTMVARVAGQPFIVEFDEDVPDECEQDWFDVPEGFEPGRHDRYSNQEGQTIWIEGCYAILMQSDPFYTRDHQVEYQVFVAP